MYTQHMDVCLHTMHTHSTPYVEVRVEELLEHFLRIKTLHVWRREAERKHYLKELGLLLDVRKKKG